MCQSLGVSKSAAIIRLRQLGYIEDRPFAEYDDRWRCGHEQKHPGFRAFAGNAGKDTEGATRHNKSKDAHDEMPYCGIIPSPYLRTQKAMSKQNARLVGVRQSLMSSV